MEDTLKENVILLRCDDDYDFIYGVLILKGNILDLKLLQRRLNDMKGELSLYCDRNEVVQKVLKRYDEYKNLKYIPYNNYDLEV